MADVIKLVQGDNLPYIKLTLTDADGRVMNVATATVVVYFRAAGTTTILTTLQCAKVTDGRDGLVKFNFPGSTLNIAPGNYEGEVEVTFPDGLKQTVYEILKFKLRGQFN